MPVTSHRSFSPMPAFHPADGVVVKKPERAAPGYWVGCPGVLHEPATGRFLLSYRERHPRGTEPERGWRCALAVSDDGVGFTDVWEVRKDQLGTSSMERMCLVPTPGGGYRLYLSYVDPSDSRWRIDVLDADDPAHFDLANAKPVLTAAGTGTEGVKDPYVLQAGPVTFLFASFAVASGFTEEERKRAHSTGDIYNVGVTTHPTGLATSLDGLSFAWHGTVLDIGKGWDSYQARLNCVIPTGAGYLGFYDGSAGAHENYEERCGIAFSTSLWQWQRLTAEGPWITGPDGTGSIRYVDAAVVGREWWIYYELSRGDGAHELRLQRLRVG